MDHFWSLVTNAPVCKIFLEELKKETKACDLFSLIKSKFQENKLDHNIVGMVSDGMSILRSF